MKALRPILILSLFSAACFAQGLEYIKAHYTKYEYRIAMRDGKKLFTSVYVPKDASQKYPIMLDRTPYSVSPYGIDNYKTSLGPSEKFAKEGFIFVYQDVRGRYMSEGQFRDMTPHLDVKRGPQDVDESSDTYDTIDWLVKNLPNNNGNVGMWGISYPGFYTAAGIIDAHPALKAASPQAPITDWFVGDDFHHNGALYLPHMFRFFSGFGHPRPEPTVPQPAAPQTNLPRRLQLLPLARPALQHQRKALQERCRVLDPDDPASRLRRVLAGAGPAPPPEEHQARGDDRGRLVRRGGPVRRAEYL